MGEIPRRLTVGRLRLMLGLLFAALVIPAAILTWQAQRQIRWEAFHQYRTLADELAQRIDAELQRLVAAEEARSVADYRFVVVSGDPATSAYVHPSPLAQFPVQSEVPGLIGWFQVDAGGAFSTPALPVESGDVAAYGITEPEARQRAALRDRLRDVLAENQLVAGARKDAAAPSRESAQRSFDQLNTVAQDRVESKLKQRVEDLKLDDKRYAQYSLLKSSPEADGEAMRQKATGAKTERYLRKEQAILPEAAPVAAARGAPAPHFRLFDSEVAPFELAHLESGHFVLYRNVWRDGQRLIQGALIDQAAFLEAEMARPFRQGPLLAMSELLIGFRGEVLQSVSGEKPRGAAGPADDLTGELLHQVRLSAPLSDFQLIWKINQLPAGPGGRVVGWASVVLLAVLIAGFIAIERAGVRQIQLVAQQQDFVSAVSHELKTPLTSIRMYGEMLREGWVSEEKKPEYYRFIFEESERLSRLIANVLRLARLERNDLVLSPTRVRVEALVDQLRSKLVTQIERAGFTCEWTVDPDCAAIDLQVDADAVAQIVINLVDNALKFAGDAERRHVELSIRRGDAGHVVWTVRDHGPGVPREQEAKIFRLFYRPGSELTRRTPGTGIGLALARQLARAMHGDVRLAPSVAGAAFEVILPTAG